MRSCRPPGPSRPAPSARLAGGLVVLLVLAVFTPVARSQDQDAHATALAEADRAYRAGEYDRVDALVASARNVPDAVVLRARAAVARGRYDEALRLLTPLADAEPAGDAALELGLLFQVLGRSDEATRRLDAIVARRDRARDQDALVRAARAARALGRYEQANTIFRDAVVMATDDALVQTAWGELLLEKHNGADASRSFRQAIQIDRSCAPAYLGLARVTAETNPKQARQILARALRLNPSLVDALVFLATLDLDDDDRDGATKALGQALAVNPKSLEALSLQGAMALIDDRADAFQAAVDRVLAINPRYGAVYRVAGAQAARHYRFEEAVTLARKAVALDADDAQARAELGMHLLRTGDERGAREMLDAAFRLDPYDVVTYNLLSLLDTLDRFVTVEDGPILMRLDPDEAPVLRERAMPLAREALATLAARYGVTPQAPILVEIFPRHDDFAVRTLGLPGMIGALGACFGRVVTLDSPKARPPGTFSWEATLWHEMAHVVTLQLSKQRVPRWLTEGISVYEERRARPGWGREMQLAFAEAMDDAKVLPLAELNAGFSSPDTIALAYYQASLVVQHIVESRGDDALRTMLRAYGEGLDTEAAVKRGLGVTLAQLQTTFDEALERQFAGVHAAMAVPPDGQLARASDPLAFEALAAAYPASYPVMTATAQALEDAGETAKALAAWQKASRLLPEATGAESPWPHIVSLQLKAGDKAGASATLEAQLAHDHTNIEAARQLVSLLPATDRARLLQAQTRIIELDPFDSAAASDLGRRALESGDADAAARWFRAALATGPRDPVSAHCDLAEAYLRLGATSDARRQTLAALEIAPTYPRAQDMLLSIVEARP